MQHPVYKVWADVTVIYPDGTSEHYDRACRIFIDEDMEDAAFFVDGEQEEVQPAFDDRFEKILP